MTAFEWIIGSLIVGLFGSNHIYYRLACKRIKEVKEDLLILRNNDLHHINLELSQLKDHVFTLAKDK